MANRYGTEGNDIIDGTFVADIIGAYGGNDVLRGFAGDDLIFAGADDDWMDGGQGADSLYGLSGFDTASYESATGGVLIRLEGGLCQNGAAQGDRLYDVEKVIGSNLGDSLYGADGFAETLLGGAGDDQVVGSTGADDLRGGAGLDTLSYLLSDSGVNVNLATNGASGGDAQGDTIGGFERLSGSYFADTLTGSGGDNLLFGALGDDTIRGGGGKDVIVGGGGRDLMRGGAAADLFLFTASADSGTGAATRDVIEDFSRSQGDQIKIDIFAPVGTPGFPQPFDFVGGDAFTAARQVRFVQQNGDTIVQVNVTGDGGAELAIQINGLINLQASDFLLG